MFIEHVALWTERLEAMRDFYCRYFGATAGPRYHNPQKGFTSYFLSFGHGARLELMARDDVTARHDRDLLGQAHFALAVGRPDAVDALVARLVADGIPLAAAPRWTGDGYYEAIVRDPDGNRIEIMATPDAGAGRGETD